jgi:hypothetical protein
MVIVLEYKNVTEIIEHEFFKAEGKLDGDRTDENGHFRSFLHFYIVKLPVFFEQVGAKKKFSLFLEAKSIIIINIPGYNRMIESFIGDKLSELLPHIEFIEQD